MNLRTDASIDANGQPAETEDKELVLAFKRGEDGSYQAIYDRYSARINGICRRMLQQPHDAEEAQQETLMRVFTGLPNFNGRYQLGAWVSRIATNVCLDHIRSKGRKPVNTTDNATLVDISDDSADDPEEIFMQGDERQRVREVLTGLAPMHRAALALREFEGMSYADIAVALGMTEPQVKALIHRARRSFKKRWAHGLALLLPWRLLARFRRFSSHYDAPPQLADAAASTANLASSCSAVLHQCGAILTDKAAGAFTALVVGVAAVGVAVAPAPKGMQPEVRKPVWVAQNEPTGQQGHADEASGNGPNKKEGTRERRPVAAPAPVVEDTHSEPPPAEEEEPPPAAEKEPEEGGTGKSPADTGPAPLYTYFGFDRGQPIPRASATSHSTAIDCARGTVTHSVDTLISDGAFSYRSVIDFFVTQEAARIELKVWKNGREVRYASWGAQPLVTWTTEGGTSRLEITGDYGEQHGWGVQDTELPQSGHFDATLTLDCAAQTVVTEGAGFTAQ